MDQSIGVRPSMLSAESAYITAQSLAVDGGITSFG
jgi:hypothetical protein